MWETLDLTVIAVAAVGFYLGGLLKGVVGMGLPLVAIPIVALVMPVAKAIPLMLASGYVMNLIQVKQTWHARTSIRPYVPALIGIAIGIAAGVHFATSAPESWVRGVLGAVVLIYVFLGVAHIELPARFVQTRWAGFSMGGLTGLSGGMTGGFGATLAMYLLACGLEKDRFVWLIGLLMFIGSIILSLSLAAAGNLGMDQALGTMAVLLPSWLGLTTGGYIRRKVSQQVFRNIALVALSVMGLSLLVGAVR
jgi:uncharacterized membrane protein YfcA